MNLMRLANCIALVTSFMLHLRPISAIDDHISLEALLRWAKRDSVGVSNTQRVLFLRLDSLVRDSRHGVRCSGENPISGFFVPKIHPSNRILEIMSKFSSVIAENPSKEQSLVFFDFSRLPGTSPWARIRREAPMAARLSAMLPLPSLGQIAFRNRGPSPRRATAVRRSKSERPEPARPEEDEKDGGSSAGARARVHFGDSRKRRRIRYRLAGRGRRAGAEESQE
jgi:hypothetical protein